MYRLANAERAGGRGPRHGAAADRQGPDGYRQADLGHEAPRPPSAERADTAVDSRDRVRALGHQGQGLRGSGLRAAGRQAPGQSEAVLVALRDVPHSLFQDAERASAAQLRRHHRSGPRSGGQGVHGAQDQHTGAGRSGDHRADSRRQHAAGSAGPDSAQHRRVSRGRGKRRRHSAGHQLSLQDATGQADRPRAGRQGHDVAGVRLVHAERRPRGEGRKLNADLLRRERETRSATTCRSCSRTRWTSRWWTCRGLE